MFLFLSLRFQEVELTTSPKSKRAHPTPPPPLCRRPSHSKKPNTPYPNKPILLEARTNWYSPMATICDVIIHIFKQSRMHLCLEFVRPAKADKSRRSEGLVSADRSEAAALLGTTPRSIYPSRLQVNLRPFPWRKDVRDRGQEACTPHEAQIALDTVFSLAGVSLGLPRPGRRRWRDCRVPVGIPTYIKRRSAVIPRMVSLRATGLSIKRVYQRVPSGFSRQPTPTAPAWQLVSG